MVPAGDARLRLPGKLQDFEPLPALGRPHKLDEFQLCQPAIGDGDTKMIVHLADDREKQLFAALRIVEHGGSPHRSVVVFQGFECLAQQFVLEQFLRPQYPRAGRGKLAFVSHFVLALA
jgi:hypothetical protein